MVNAIVYTRTDCVTLDSISNAAYVNVRVFECFRFSPLVGKTCEKNYVAELKT